MTDCFAATKLTLLWRLRCALSLGTFCRFGKLRQNVKINRVVVKQKLGKNIDREMMVAFDGGHQSFKCVQPFAEFNHGYPMSRFFLTLEFYS